MLHVPLKLLWNVITGPMFVIIWNGEKLILEVSVLGL